MGVPLHLLDQRPLLLTIDDAEDLLIELSESDCSLTQSYGPSSAKSWYSKKGWKIQRIERGL